MSGRVRFLLVGLVCIILASLLLFYGFSTWEPDSTNTLDLNDGDNEGSGLDDEPLAGAEADDSDYDAVGGTVPDNTQDNSQVVAPAENDIPWGGGIVVFVLLGSSVMLVLFARIREEDVLEGLRKDIFEYISENPGEHLAEITRHFDISSSSARHHLDVLEWSDKIVSHKSGKQKHFYPNRNGYRKYTSGYGYKEIMAILKNDTCRGMVKILISNDRANQKSIAQALNIHPSTVNWHAKRMRQAQIIFKTRDGKDIHYSLNPELDLVKVISLIEGAGS